MRTERELSILSKITQLARGRDWIFQSPCSASHLLESKGAEHQKPLWAAC